MRKLILSALSLVSVGLVACSSTDITTSTSVSTSSSSITSSSSLSSSLIINEELLALVGATNAELKEANGVDCEMIERDNFYLLLYSTSAKFPFQFMMGDYDDEAIKAALSDEKFPSHENMYPDTSLVTSFRTDSSFLFGKEDINEADINNFFGIEPEQLYPYDYYVDYGEYVMHHYCVYQYNGIDIYIAYSEDGSILHIIPCAPTFDFVGLKTFLIYT